MKFAFNVTKCYDNSQAVYNALAKKILPDGILLVHRKNRPEAEKIALEMISALGIQSEEVYDPVDSADQVITFEDDLE